MQAGFAQKLHAVELVYNPKKDRHARVLELWQTYRPSSPPGAAASVFDTGTALEGLDLMEWQLKQVVDPTSSPVAKAFNAYSEYDPNPNVALGLYSEEPTCW